MSKNNKKMTIDELARITKAGFDGLTERFEGRFNSVEGRFNSVDKRFDGIEGRLSKVENDVGYLRTHMVDKYYLSDKLADLAVEIYKRLDKKLIKEKEFKKKITEIIKRNKLATPRELAYLEGLIR